MSSTGRIRPTTPLFPCLPDSLSPSDIFLLWATHILISLFTPSDKFWSSRVSSFTPITVPLSPWGRSREEFFISRAFSPNIARRSLASAVSSVSPRGVILPTSISPCSSSAPTRTMPFSSRFLKASSPTLGMSRVISSGPTLVSRASISYSSMWMEVNLSSRTKFSLMMMASS